MECIDVLMATYNGEKYVKQQIESILNQSYKNIRLIISDDCSTDRTREILNEYKEKDERIEVIFHEKNKGLVKNFEFLLSKVKSDYFMFSDQDDFWKEDKILVTFEKMKDENADLVYTDLEVVDQNLNLISSSYWRLKGLYKKIDKYGDFNSLYLNNFVTGCTMLMKKEWINKITPFPISSKYVLHDYWIALIISQGGKIVGLDVPTIKYRQHQGNEVGSKKKYVEYDKFDDVRNLFINVKVEHFQTFVDNNNFFEDEKIKQLNEKCLDYYNDLNKHKLVYLKNIRLFWKLYKYEDFKYSILNFIILHFPICIRGIYNFYIKLKKR